MMPTDKNSHGTIITQRKSFNHAGGSSPRMRAAMATAKGTVMPT